MPPKLTAVELQCLYELTTYTKSRLVGEIPEQSSQGAVSLRDLAKLENVLKDWLQQDFSKKVF